MHPSVFIIILNFNHLEDLKETIFSFKKQDYSNFKLIVSDNASNDKSIEWLKGTYPDIIVLENKKNLGWGGGNNVGINYALHNQAEYVLLANNDLSIDDTTTVSRMVLDMERLKENNISIIGTCVNYFYEKRKIHNMGWILYPKGEKRGHFFNEFRKKCSIRLEANYKLVDAADGCFFMIDSDVF